MAETSVEMAKRMGVETKPKDYFNAIYKARNSVKHMKASKSKEDITGDEVVSFNAEKEAYDMIDEAITNYYHLSQFLQLPVIKHIETFDNFKRDRT